MLKELNNWMNDTRSGRTTTLLMVVVIWVFTITKFSVFGIGVLWYLWITYLTWLVLKHELTFGGESE